MGYYMRFISTSASSLSFGSLEEGLQVYDTSYRISRLDGDDSFGSLYYDDLLCGQIDIGRLDPEELDEEIEELIEDVESVGVESPDPVLRTLHNATAVVAVQVLHQGREVGESLEKLDPLWAWLFENFTGYLQADGEGYYDINGLVLEIP